MTLMLEDQKATTLDIRTARICDVVERWSEVSPNQKALVDAAGTLTYAELADLIASTETWLAGLGIRPGDRVMIVCENCSAFVAILLAAARLDAWPVLINARLSAREIDQIQEHCRARRVFFTTGSSPQALQHAKRHNATIQEVAGLGSIGVGKLDEHVAPEPIGSDNRVAALIYTSGTTGLPKGVMLTHQNLLFVAARSSEIRSLTPQDRLCGVLPMSHVVGLSVVLLGTLLSGATLYLLPRFDPVAVLGALEREELTVMLGVPAMFALLIEYAKFKKIKSLNLPRLRIISTSGAPLDAPLKTAVEDLFGLVLHNGYGLTECSPNIAQTRIEQPCTDISVGQLFPGVEAKLVDAEQQPVKDGEVGELWVRGPNIMKGYYRAPEETAQVIDKDGWFNTRDLACWKNGNLFIVGRMKELIVRFGLNVYPAEVESVLNIHPGVARSAVIGRSVDGVAGYEEVVAFVEPSAGAKITEAEITKHAAQHLAPYKRPSQVFVIPKMPVGPSGKIIKRELMRMAAHVT